MKAEMKMMSSHLGVLPMPGVGHGVRRRQRLVRPHRVSGARRPRLQHDTPKQGTPSVTPRRCPGLASGPHWHIAPAHSLHCNALARSISCTDLFIVKMQNPDRKLAIDSSFAAVGPSE